MFRPRLRTAPSSLCRRQPPQQIAAAFQPSCATSPHKGSGRRRLHHVPISRHDERVGVPNLLSPEGFDLAWTQQMKLVLSRLNELTAGTDFEERDLKSIILDTARIPSQAALFNHASMAHNTDFFFKQLRPAGLEAGSSSSSGGDAVPPVLRSAIEDNFGSMETLRREFVATAAAMFGPGFVWLVKANHLHQTGRGGDSLRLLVTYLAGSPYPGAHWRRQAVDMNTVGAEDSASGSGGGGGASAGTGSTNAARDWLNRQAAAVSSAAAAANTASSATPLSSSSSSALPLSSGSPPDRRPPGGIDVIPLLCLSTWEHVWLRDYGLGADGNGGKVAYVEAWWNAVDWDAVAEMVRLNRPKLMT